MSDEARKKVLIVYPFLMHYRKPVFEELIRNGRHQYFFAAGRNLSGSIENCELSMPERLLKTRNYVVLGVFFQLGLMRLIFTRKFDCLILLGNVNWPMTWVCSLMARLMRKRVLFWSHGWIRREQGLVSFIRNLFYRLAHGMLLYGHTAKRIGMGFGFASDKLYVVYNALDYDRQSRIRDSVNQQDVADVRELV